MRQKNNHYQALLQLEKYRSKLMKLLNAPPDHRIKRRIDILKKRIIRLIRLICGRYIKASSISACCLLALSVHAQTFGPQQLNPFGLTNQTFYNRPAFVDIDADGDYDCFTGDWFGDLEYYENTGTNSAPSFSYMGTNLFGLTGNYNYASPAFADIDADGDYDLFVGYYDYGNILFFENTGSNTAPVFAAPQLNPFGLTSNGSYYSFPCLADMDADGDYDLMTGDLYGNFFYFENIGSPSAPVFTNMQVNPFGLTQNGGYWSTVALSDIDCDGDIDLFCGQGSTNNIVYYENTGSINAPSFATSQVNPFGISPAGNYLEPAFCDIDADGDQDLFCGDGNGDFLFFENTEINNPPVIASVNDTSICRDDTAAMTITFNDACLYYLNTMASSNNQSLIPDANISIIGNGSNRLLTAIPLSGQTGVAYITVYATDIGNKQDSTGFNITVQGPESVFSASDTAVCAGDTVYFTNASANANAFEWLVNGSQAATTQDFSAAWSSGTYTVQLVADDSTACPADTSSGVQITVHPAPALNFTFTEDNGNCQGSATAIPVGGTAPYTYQWDANAGNQTTQTADSLCAGNYCVTVTDANGCTKDTCADVPLGMDHLAAVPRLFIHPNPGKGQLLIRIEPARHQPMELQIVNSLGQTVYSRHLGLISGNYQLQTDLTALAKGAYILKLQSKDWIISRKIILQ